MAEDRDQKTQEPTEKKLSDARQRGDVPFAPEARHAAMFAAALLVTGRLAGTAFATLGRTLLAFWSRADELHITGNDGQAFASLLLRQVALALAPIFAAVIFFALVGIAIQGRPSLSWSRIMPRISKLSPIAGAGRLLGKRALMEFAKTLAKLSVVIAVAYLSLRPHIGVIMGLVGASPMLIILVAGTLVFALVKSVSMLVALIAALDIFYQRRSWLGRMRMTLQEVKDEHRQNEGDPKIKAKIRSIAIQRSRRRMMAAVPKASVVITNPTHYAVALKYDHGRMSAPVVIAKGAEAVAMKIREVARTAGVPVVESPPLARALYAAVKLDHPVPVEHYAAVAEIISYVLRLAGHRPAPPAPAAIA